MSPYEMAKAAAQRPHNYARLSGQRQWDIDSSLGLLDWGGLNLMMVKSYLDKSEGEIQGRFGMSKDELLEVVGDLEAWMKAAQELTRRHQ